MRLVYLVFLFIHCIVTNLCAQENAYEKSIRYYKENRLDSAVTSIDQAIAAYQKIAATDSLVFSYSHKALIVWDASGAADALQILDTALKLCDKLPQKSLSRVSAYSRAGQIYTHQQIFDKANNYLQRAEKSIPHNDTLNKPVAFLYNNIALMHLMREAYDAAMLYAQRSYRLNTALQGKDGTDMPSILQTIYHIQQYGEQYEEALKSGLELQRVMQLHYSPTHKAIGTMHNSLGNIYEALLQYDEALYHRQKALDIQFKNYNLAKNNGFSLASAYHNLGNLYSYINEHYLAREYLSKGSVLFEEIYGPDGRGMIDVLVALADNQRKLQAYAPAQQLYERAYSLQKKYGVDDYIDMAYVETFYGDLYHDQSLYKEAESLYRLSLQHFEKAKAQHTRLALQTKKALAEIMAATGRQDEAINMGKSVLNAFRKIYPAGNDGIADKLYSISEMYASLGKTELSLSYSDSVFTELAGGAAITGKGTDWIKRLPFSYNTSVYMQHRLKLLQQMHAATGNKQSLHEILLLADVYGEYISLNLSAFRTQATLTELSTVHKQIYATAIEACWLLSNEGADIALMEKAFGYSERSKALLLRLAANNLLVDASADKSDPMRLRDYDYRKRIAGLNARYLNNSPKADSLLHLLTATMEAYRLFQDSIRRDGNELLAAKYRLEPFSLNDIRAKLLSKGETMLQYTVTENAIFAFAVNASQLAVKKINKEVLAGVKKLQQLNGLSVAAFREPAYLLYQSLIQPLEPFFASNSLLIVPDAELYFLNFELLISNNKGNRFSDMPYLVKSSNISYLLSATSAIQYSQGSWQQQKQKALLFAPVFTDDMKQLYRAKTASLRDSNGDEYLYLHRQPFALQAAQQIGRFIPNDLYKEQQAQENTFKQFAGAYQVLHLGTHAEVNDAAQLQSKFFFAQPLNNDSADTDDGYLHIYEIYAMQLNAELAVLTACETGSGALHQGEGVVSLANSFMHAGCRGVVMSLWKIDEKSSMQIITDFYRYLSEGYDKSEALRKAKLDLIAGNTQMAHPYYWAGLTFTGERTALHNSKKWNYWIIAGGLILVVITGIYFSRKK